jgi:hypothetical protein
LRMLLPTPSTFSFMNYLSLLDLVPIYNIFS